MNQNAEGTTEAQSGVIEYNVFKLNELKNDIHEVLRGILSSYNEITNNLNDISLANFNGDIQGVLRDIKALVETDKETLRTSLMTFISMMTLLVGGIRDTEKDLYDSLENWKSKWKQMTDNFVDNCSLFYGKSIEDSNSINQGLVEEVNSILASDGYSPNTWAQSGTNVNNKG